MNLNFFDLALIHIVLMVTLGVFYMLIRRQLSFAVTAFLIGLTTYFLIVVLSKNEFGIAAGLGLFAIFGIIRYRTEQVPILEMTYIFVCITMSVIAALTDGIILTFLRSLSINILLGAISVLLIYFYNRTEKSSLKLNVDGLGWMKKSREEILGFLNEKSCCDVTDYSIESIDWLRESAAVTVYFKKRP